MNLSIKKIFFNKSAFQTVAALVVSFVLSVSGVGAFNADFYRDSSVLSQGRWVKIGVSESGLYRLTPALLRQWGFSDPARVRVLGLGGQRPSDILSMDNFNDDLSVVPTFRLNNGSIVFYGVGPEQWTSSVANRYTQTTNIYTTEGFYFLTEVQAGDSVLVEKTFTPIGSEGASVPGTTFWDRMHHEVDLVSPGEAGPQLVGEDFRLTKSRKFSFDLTDRADDGETDIWMECSFVAKTYGQASKISFTANNQTLPEISADRIGASANDDHYHGIESIGRRLISGVKGNQLTLAITHSSPVTVHGAWLNYLTINYLRKLRVPTSGYLMFWSNEIGLTLDNTKTSTRIVDVTTPADLKVIDIQGKDGSMTWTNSHAGWRTYVAFNEDAALPSPTYRGTVANQDLHARLKNGDLPAMFILGNSSMRPAANRIIALHAADPIAPLKAEFVDVNQIYNEFGSGAADPGAIRRFFKMAYDMGYDPDDTDNGSTFKYALLMARPTYDNRFLTAGTAKYLGGYTIPGWANGNMHQSLNDTDGYNTDDVLAMLKDGSGSNKGLDDLMIAIGRIPATSVTQANSYVDKLEQYMNSSKKTSWKNQVMVLADDADRGTHMNQAEKMIAQSATIERNPLKFNKVYIDAYPKVNSQYPLAREAMFRLLDEGTVWWTYIGHANNHSLTHDGQLTYHDMNNLYLKNPPVFYAATCDFLRWDSNTMSGGEILFFERYGGTIAVISATRPVYIYENGLLSNAVGRHIGARDSKGRILSIGEIYRRAKNNILTDAGRHDSNTNRLKYVLMGDPAMRPAIPDLTLELQSIGDRPLTSVDDLDHEPIVLGARANTVARGVILSTDGQIDESFDGIVTLSLYDAEYSTTTNGNNSGDSEGTPVTFEQQGPRLVAASAPVKNGQFEVAISIPTDISDNFRQAAISMYAYSTVTNDEAAGITRDLYVYGLDETSPADSIAPAVESIYLNHSTFVSGGVVNSSPMLIAEVSDNIALNLSTSGIGHAMTIKIDGQNTLADVSSFYTPSPDGRPAGSIHYPLEGLTPGAHSLTLRVWDTAANSASATIDFVVDASAAPKIYDITTDANPAVDRANFFILHDRPDQMATVTISVYNLLGRPIWSKTVTGVSDMFTSTPVTWDLTDTGGRRVPRGIYLYRATITCENETFDTGSRRIAVANP